jgi:hypothetical protein
MRLEIGDGGYFLKIYLANFFSKKDEMRRCREELQKMGIVVTSRWLDESVAPKSAIGDVSDKLNCINAMNDVQDVMDADVLLFFTSGPKDLRTLPVKSLARGGRHVEFGMGIVAKKRLILCGQRENVFHFLPEVEQYNTWAEVKTMLMKETL